MCVCVLLACCISLCTSDIAIVVATVTHPAYRYVFTLVDISVAGPQHHNRATSYNPIE